MVWVRLDDQFPIHRKVSPVSDAAFRLHVEALCWCARNLTDGHIEHEELRVVTRIGRPERYAAELVRWGAWRETESGWEIHDYLEYQQSRSKVLRTRESRSAAGKVGGQRSGQSRRAGKTAGQKAQGSKDEAKPKQVASHVLEPPAPFLLSEGRTGSAPAPLGAARPPNPRDSPAVDDSENPNWRTLKAFAEQPDHAIATRTRTGAEATRAQIRRPPKPAPPQRDALAELRSATEPPETRDDQPNP